MRKRISIYFCSTLTNHGEWYCFGIIMKNTKKINNMFRDYIKDILDKLEDEYISIEEKVQISKILLNVTKAYQLYPEDYS